MTVTGISHVTLAVTDLDRSIEFYTDTLGARLRAHWPRGAYLELGALWLCLEVAARVSDRRDDSHLALAVSTEAFGGYADRVRGAAPVWKENRSEGPSLYVRDPDGHKLELHAGDLESRLAALRGRADVTILPGDAPDPA